MRVIRKNVFETNSSSTHAICISKESNNLEIPETIEIDLEDYEFGWEFDIRTGYHSKLAYILIGILNYKDIVNATERVNKLLNILKQWVESIEIKGIGIQLYSNDTRCSIYFNTEDGYIDHSSELNEFIDTLLDDENLLKRYLFERDSFISTGNDNSDESVIKNRKELEKTHDIYWKGN